MIISNRENDRINNEKHYKSQFIFKLVSIIEDFPELINWSEDGQSIQIIDQNRLENQVLQKYFRHSKINSFFRQMNLYDFKLNKKEKYKQIFTHEIFKKGNQLQFYEIKRNKKKKYIKQMQKTCQTNLNKIEQKLLPAENLNEEIKFITNNFAEYKIQIVKKQKFIKNKTQALFSQLKNSRNEKINRLMRIIKQEIIPQIQQNQKYSTSIFRNLNQFVSDSNTKLEQILVNQEQKDPRKNKQEKYHFLKQSSFCIPLNFYKQSEKCLMNWNSQIKSENIQKQKENEKKNERRLVQNNNKIQSQSSQQISFAD